MSDDAASEPEKPKPWSDAIDGAHKLLTLITAAGTFWIGMQVQGLDMRIKTESITHTFADKIFAHLQDLNVTEKKQKEAVVIELLDIIAEANTSASGGRDNDPNRRLDIPLRMALITENPETLAHIGAGLSRRRRWVGLARESGNSAVRATAILALATVTEHGLQDERASRDGAETVSNANNQVTQVLQNLDDVLQLSNDMRDPATLAVTADSITRIATVMVRDPLAYRGELRVKRAYERVRDAKTGLVGQDSSSDDIAKTLKALEGALGLFQEWLVDPEPQVPPVSPESQATGGKNDLSATKELIGQIKSDDSSKRRQARAALAEQGSPSMRALLDELHTAGSDYRVKVAVASVAFKLPQPVVVTEPSDVTALVALIGDSDPLVRKYSSEFLMKLYHPETVRAVRAELEKTIGAEQNDNAVYNAAVILSTWVRVLPPELDPERTEIRTTLIGICKGLAPQRWSNTRKVMQDLLKLNGDCDRLPA